MATKYILLSAENIKKAKQDIMPLVRDFFRHEPKNTLVIPETKQGSAAIDTAFAKLETLGYSPEDAQLMISEMVEALSLGEDPAATSAIAVQRPPRDENF